MDYYNNKYNIRIKNTKQPLLVSQPSKADRRRGMVHPIVLIPELCYLTGLSDDQRADFSLMKVINKSYL